MTLPREYPFKSPSIGFVNRLYHPNVDDLSGSVCLDVINQTWSPMFDLVNVFDAFLPQLLRYPNPTDPLNGEAAALMMRDADGYARRIREHVAQHASRDFQLGARDDGARARDAKPAAAAGAGAGGRLVAAGAGPLPVPPGLSLIHI